MRILQNMEISFKDNINISFQRKYFLAFDFLTVNKLKLGEKKLLGRSCSWEITIKTME